MSVRMTRRFLSINDVEARTTLDIALTVIDILKLYCPMTVMHGTFVGFLVVVRTRQGRSKREVAIELTTRPFRQHHGQRREAGNTCCPHVHVRLLLVVDSAEATTTTSIFKVVVLLSD